MIVVGGGTAGLVTAAGAAALGRRVALCERDALGGDCLWTGCVPSKALLASAGLAHSMRHAEGLGLDHRHPDVTFRHVMERMRRARERVAEHDDPERFRAMGVEVVEGSATITAPNEIRVGRRCLRARDIVVATGAGPTVPPIDGLEAAGYLTYVSAFDQNELPERIAIVGGGPVGVEFAQIYARLGARVSLIERLPTLLSVAEPDARDVLEQTLVREGIDVRTGTGVERVAVDADGGKVLHLAPADGSASHDGSTSNEGSASAAAVNRSEPPDGSTRLACDEVFVATGRRPAAGGLGLEEIGVELRDGAVAVDAGLRSTVGGIWAAGDVTGGPQFTHAAEYQAKLLLRNALFPFRSKADYSMVPSVTYSDPEIATVGLTRGEAEDRYGSVRCFETEFHDLDRAIVDASTAGFVRIVTRGRGRIVGATIVGSRAGDLLAPILVAMRSGARIKDLSQVVYPYPTMSEGVKRAADTYYRELLGGRAGSMLRTIVRWLN